MLIDQHTIPEWNHSSITGQYTFTFYNKKSFLQFNHFTLPWRSKFKVQSSPINPEVRVSSMTLYLLLCGILIFCGIIWTETTVLCLTFTFICITITVTNTLFEKFTCQPPKICTNRKVLMWGFKCTNFWNKIILEKSQFNNCPVHSKSSLLPLNKHIGSIRIFRSTENAHVHN